MAQENHLQEKKSKMGIGNVLAFQADKRLLNTFKKTFTRSLNIETALLKFLSVPRGAAKYATSSTTLRCRYDIVPSGFTWKTVSIGLELNFHMF